MARFPQIHRNLSPKYNKMVDALNQQVPMRIVAKVNPDVISAGILIAVALGLCLVIRRWGPRKSAIGWRARSGFARAERRTSGPVGASKPRASIEQNHSVPALASDAPGSIAPAEAAAT
jgi:hypothetical protein